MTGEVCRLAYVEDLWKFDPTSGEFDRDSHGGVTRRCDSWLTRLKRGNRPEAGKEAQRIQENYDETLRSLEPEDESQE